MMMYKFTIYGTLPDLNAEIKAAKSHYAMYAKHKAAADDKVMWCVREQLPGIVISGGFALAVKWYMPNKRKDHDNVYFGTKYILDGMKKAGLIPDDNPNHFNGGASHEPGLDRKHPRIIVRVLLNQRIYYEE